MSDRESKKKAESEPREPPLSETIELTMPPPMSGVTGEYDTQNLPIPYEETSSITHSDSISDLPQPHRTIAPGEALQLVRFSRRENTLMISGLTPHGRRLTFEQRSDREGWYVVTAGRRRRPTERELGLVVASITQEMEAASAPEGDAEVRSAYRLASTSDQPGINVRGLQSYHDLLLDEAGNYVERQSRRLGVVAVEYQAFKRFALRHGHRIGAAFVRALGERLDALFAEEKKVHVCHKTGKSFRIIAVDRSAAEVQKLVKRITSDETRRWIVERVWGEERRTHPDEVNFYIGIAMARPKDRTEKDYEALGQRLNDDAYRAAKLGQLKGHTSIQIAKSDYRTTVNQWLRASEDEIDELASQMDDGPAEVMSEMTDYLHELVPADLEGMAVEGDLHALIHKAIARDGFWQGTTAMRIVGERLIGRFLEGRAAPAGENQWVGGFDLGDEFYGITIEGDRLYFAWGDLNSAGATRIRAGLDRIQHAVGWKRVDGGGIVGRFLRALAPDGMHSLAERIRETALASYRETAADPAMHVNDAVDIGDYLWTEDGELVDNADVREGESFVLALPHKKRAVRVLDMRSRFILTLEIDGIEHPAAFHESFTGPYVRLRLRSTVISMALCVLEMKRQELEDILYIVREDNSLPEDSHMDIVGFLRHIADILLAEQVKSPGKIELALGATYDPKDFIKFYSLETVREQHPGLFYEAVHHNLLAEETLGLDRNLSDLVASTMLAQTRPPAGAAPSPRR